MKKIRKLLRFNRMNKYTVEQLEQIAKEEFIKFNNDKLKIKYLKRVYNKLPLTDLSADPLSCAELLVEEKVYEGANGDDLWRNHENSI